MSMHVRNALLKAKKNPDRVSRAEALKYVFVPVYDRTKGAIQAFKDSCDVNQILEKAAVAGGLSHVQKYPEAVYGEFDGAFDLLTAHERIQKANEIFADLPAETRKEFGNNALEFVTWAASQPAGDLVKKIPEISKPGKYFPNPVKTFGTGAGMATTPSEVVAAARSADDPVPPTSSDAAPAEGASGASDG